MEKNTVIERTKFDEFLDKHEKSLFKLSVLIGLIIGIYVGYITN